MNTSNDVTGANLELVGAAISSMPLSAVRIHALKECVLPLGTLTHPISTRPLRLLTSLGFML